MLAITVKVDVSKGKEIIYPVSNDAKALANLAKTETFSRDDIKQIQALGYKIITLLDGPVRRGGACLN